MIAVGGHQRSPWAHRAGGLVLEISYPFSAISRSIAAMLSKEHLRTNVSDIWIKIKTCSCCKVPQKLLFVIYRPLCSVLSIYARGTTIARIHSGYGSSQWETALRCNAVSHWLRPYPAWSLSIVSHTGTSVVAHTVLMTWNHENAQYSRATHWQNKICITVQVDNRTRIALCPTKNGVCFVTFDCLIAFSIHLMTLKFLFQCHSSYD